MGPIVYEDLQSSDGEDGAQSKDSRRTLSYWALGYANVAAAKAAVEALLPATITIIGGPDLVKSTLTFQTFGPAVWKFDQLYLHPDLKTEDVDTGSYLFGFDTTGGTQHITQSRQTISSTAIAGFTAPDFQGLIGFDGKSPSGTDVVVPKVQLEIRKRQPLATLTLAYVATLRSLTGKYNDAAFLGYPAGEFLFLGARGEQQSEGDPEITYFFLWSENLTNISVGTITVPAKKGHEYLWVYYTADEDATAKALVKRPFAAYVERVSEPGDFSQLAI